MAAHDKENRLYIISLGNGQTSLERRTTKNSNNNKPLVIGGGI